MKTSALALLIAFVPLLSRAAGAEDSAIEPPIAAGEISRALSLLAPADGWSLKPDQKTEFDTRSWALEALADGSEIFTFKGKTPEQKRAVLRDKGNLSSVSAYTLQSLGKKDQREDSASVVFHKGRLYALTKCTDNGGADGRDCLTVTRQVCEFVKEPAVEFPKKLSDELKVIEVRALATILTLRGADHQLENVSKHGNRLGLKDPLQTTKGKLTAKDKAKAVAAHKRAKELCEIADLGGGGAKVAALRSATPEGMNSAADPADKK